MAILSSVDIGEGIVSVVVDHDPTSVTTDVLKGSRITEQSTGFIFIKTDDGATTNVKKLFSQAGEIFAGANESVLSDVENLKVNLTAIVDPTTTDDTNAGYSVGSRWVNVSTDKSFICLDVTASAAVWKRTNITEHPDLGTVGIDDHHPRDHALGGSTHSADTLANLNAKVSDATLDDSSATRTPSAHALGGSEHTADTLANVNAKVSDATLIDTADSRFDNFFCKLSAEGAIAVFAGSPDGFYPEWDATDAESYLEITATATNDKGGIVQTFVVPNGVTAIISVKVTGKLSNVSDTAINVRVFDTGATQVATGSITAITKTTLTLTVFSPTPVLTAGGMIRVEIEGHVGTIGNSAFLGTTIVEFDRT